jgi:hypothetical protein
MKNLSFSGSISGSFLFGLIMPHGAALTIIMMVKEEEIEKSNLL